MEVTDAKTYPMLNTEKRVMTRDLEDSKMTIPAAARAMPAEP